MKLYYLLFISVCFIGCSLGNSEGYFPNNTKVKVHKMRKYKSFLFINDTLSFSGTYFSNSDTKKSILYNNISIGNTILSDDKSDQYIIIFNNNGDSIKYFVSSYLPR